MDKKPAPSWLTGRLAPGFAASELVAVVGHEKAQPCWLGYVTPLGFEPRTHCLRGSYSTS